MVLFNVPVRKVTIKRDGANLEVLELAEGFWGVERGEGNEILGQSNGGATLISNPLLTAFLNELQLAPNARLAIRLVPAQFHNEGTNDEQASLNNLIGSIV